MKRFLVGADIGTTGTKTVAFDTDGRELASAVAEYPLSQPQNGWAEQNPDDWVDATCKTLKEVAAKVGADNIAGIGLSGQMHGLVLLDENDMVLRPAIIWCDGRTARQCEELKQTAEKLVFDETANPPIAGFTAAKLLWVKENEPELFHRISKIMLPKDYVRYRLTGSFATEVSDASGMQMLNVPKRQWSDEMLKLLGITTEQLPRVYESCEISGTVTEKASVLCGLNPGTPVAGGAGDQAASGVGCGIVEEGAFSVTLGTSGVVFTHCNGLCIEPRGSVHTLCHAVPGAWHMMGVTQAAGLSFKWMRDNFFTDVAANGGNRALDDIASTVPAGADGLLWLPYLMGERTPHLDADARGVFFGISAAHTKAHMLRAVLEGVIFSLMDCKRVLEETGAAAKTVYMSGGGANSTLWRQMLADAYGLPIYRRSTNEGGALGVAILAGVGTGIYSSVPAACKQILQVKDETNPNPANTAQYAKYYSLYRDLYAALKPSFKTLSAIRDDD